MPTISGQLITEGSWTSQTLTNSLGGFPTGFNGYWGELSFDFERGDAYSSIHVDILNSSGAVLLSDITLDEKENRKKANLSVLAAVHSSDMQVRIRLRAVSTSPVIRNIQILFQDTTTA